MMNHDIVYRVIIVLIPFVVDRSPMVLIMDIHQISVIVVGVWRKLELHVDDLDARLSSDANVRKHLRTLNISSPVTSNTKHRS